MKYFRFSVIALFSGLLFSQPSQRVLHVTRTAAPPVIDGYGNDDAWRHAEIASHFVQRSPFEGTDASERTEFQITYDDKNIYVYAMMYDSHPDSIVSRLARRDQDTESDFFAIGFDSYHDKQTAFIFVVLPSNSKEDILWYTDGTEEDASWDPVWESATRMLPNGWSVEMKIPLSQIRYTEGNDIWGMDAARWISRRQEESDWNLMKQRVSGHVSQFGLMTGMAQIKQSHEFEVLPYGVATSKHLPQTDSREKVESFRPNGGIDLKYGVSSNFTLDATFNPDFAQVEADPEVLNLTTFETFYPEKRPFFIEGTQILRFVTFGGDFGPGLFYSRRIGKAIDVTLPDDGAVITKQPDNATILGAAKFSGKTESGTSIGALTALTDEADFTYRDTLGVLHTLQAEPRTSYNLFRVKQDFWSSSNVGGIVTATAGNGRNPAYTSGADWDIKLDSNTYRVNGFFAHSRITTPSGEFQAGNAGKLNFGKISGNWIYSVNSDFTSRRYYINDIGFFRSPNDYGVSGDMTYRDFTPGEYFKSTNLFINPHLRWNFDGLILFRQVTLGASGTFLNNWYAQASAQYSHGEKDPYDPRGYGIYNYPSSIFARAEIESDGRENVIVNVEENYRRYTDNSTVNNVGGSLTVRPTSSMEYEASIGYATDRNFARFADAVTDHSILFSPTDPVAVYGRRDVDNVDLTVRSSILFTENLSLQWYSQFFWAKGQYHDFSVVLPNGNLQSYAYAGNVDFNRTSLISNVVLRWEYRPGSTIYVVWSHGRNFYQNGGYGTSLAANIDNTFITAPNNTYVAKISYWVNM